MPIDNQKIISINSQSMHSQVIQQNQQPKQVRESNIQRTSKLSEYRYVNFVVFLLAALVNSIPTQAFSGINSIVQNKFGYSAIIVTLNTLVFSLLHPICAFPVNWILDSIGMKFGCVIGSIILIAGVWLRSFIQVDQPALCLLGSALSAFGNMFIMNSPSKLATQWFDSKSIPVVISMAVLSTNISLILGGIIPGLFLDKESSVQEVKYFFFIQAIVVSVPMLLAAIFIRENRQVKTPTHQSSQQENKACKVQQKQSYLSTLKQMFTNKQYLKIMVVTMVSYGNMIAFLANLNQMLTILGYTDSAIIFSYTLIGALSSGVLSTICISIGLKKSLAYRKISIGLMIGNFFSLGCLSLVFLYDANKAVFVILSAACFGFFFLPTPSVLISYASQSVYPLGQASSSGYQYAASQTFGFLLGLLIVTFIKSQASQNISNQNNKFRVLLVLGFQCLLCLIGAFFAFMTKQDLRRHKHYLQQVDSKVSVLLDQEKSSCSEKERQYDNRLILQNQDGKAQDKNQDK